MSIRKEIKMTMEFYSPDRDVELSEVKKLMQQMANLVKNSAGIDARFELSSDQSVHKCAPCPPCPKGWLARKWEQVKK